ncbi:MAG TPA: aminotransferase class V-fold PLP-dependent enzyme [Bacteroidetes bacterium]|nr:aminotransferase class V-fold PLP-dependent enzyme [Bacteroidota bacterium]
MLETWFSTFRKNIIGTGRCFQTPFGEKEILYADWTASGRLYGPIEDLLQKEIAPFVGNTHTETSVTGSMMTLAYHQALNTIKQHVGASESDVIIASNSGMTGVVNKFQRILGLKIHERFQDCLHLDQAERPVVFCTHMEHHSNQTSWLETIADLEVIRPTGEGLVDLEHLKELLEKYKGRKTKIAAVTSCSNVTGLFSPYYEIAEIMHQNGGLCFVDFACSAPYIHIDMHPGKEGQCLDAIYFSPHKFLGGPGSSGILVFDSKLYKNKIPDNPGGGTVAWTNPWGGHAYIEEIEAREDGGTPGFLQAIRAGLSIKLKEKMDVEKMMEREEQMLEKIWPRLDNIPNIHVLAHMHRKRLGVISFYIDNLHYNLAVKLLNDRYGIQVRGGCSCAGTYGHYLLHVSPQDSKVITEHINEGDLSYKPGWVRMSIHPTMTDEEIEYLMQAIEALCLHHKEWGKDYHYSNKTNEYVFNGEDDFGKKKVGEWFGFLEEKEAVHLM